MKTITVLGSTGSIGVSTLDVVSMHPSDYRVFALTANKNLNRLLQQCIKFTPEFAVVLDSLTATQLAKQLKESGCKTQVLVGKESLSQVAAAPQVDIVMAAIVGAAGLAPTLSAVKAGKRVLLANKEALVMSGQLFMDAVKHNQADLLPIDSEHNAIFQCLPNAIQCGKDSCSSQSLGVEQVLLTGSGGPFLDHDMNSFERITPEQAVAHPNWSMGRKISVDSATMMNKGLEYIEARWLFGLGKDDIQVVIHPQSIIHSMVRYSDGSVLAQMGNPDMKTPIAHALAFPKRIQAGVKPLDFNDIVDFTFRAPDYDRFPNLRLAMDVFEEGQEYSTAMNAANEISVDAFLQGQIKFTDIIAVNEKVVDKLAPQRAQSLEDILEVDVWARGQARDILSSIGQ